MKIFYIIEARDPDTRHLEHRRVYTTEEQYLIRGMKQVEKFNELYDVKVTKYICNESVEVLNLKADELPPTETDVVEINESDIERIVKKVITEQKQYSDDDYDYSPYRGINTSKIEREIKRAINTKSHSLSYRRNEFTAPEGERTVTYNDPNLLNPHLEQDIKRLAERIMYAMHEDVLTYVGENYEGEIVDIINGDFR